MPENPTTESNFETELIQIARNHLSRLQQRYRDNEMQAAVRNWRERMEPILAMEEEREQFNIRRTIKRIDECLVDRQVNPPNINEHIIILVLQFLRSLINNSGTALGRTNRCYSINLRLPDT